MQILAPANIARLWGNAEVRSTECMALGMRLSEAENEGASICARYTSVMDLPPIHQMHINLGVKDLESTTRWPPRVGMASPHVPHNVPPGTL